MSSHRPWLACALTGLLLAPLLTPAAPVLKPKSDTLPALDKYLIDDADFVVTVDVKQIVGSPVFTKRFKKELQTLLAHEAVATHLKDAGLDPLKDVDRVVLAMSKSCFGESGSRRNDDGPVILFQGRFDPDKLHKKMATLAKDRPKEVTVHEAGKNKFYHANFGPDGPFVAVLDRSTVVLAGRKMHVTQLLGKASGAKRTELRHKAMAAALKAFKPEFVVQGVGLPSMVVDSSTTVRKDGAGGKSVEVKHTTLADSGFKELTIQAKLVKEVVRGRVRLTVSDKARADAFMKNFNEGFEFVKQMLKKEGQTEPKARVALRAVEGVRITSKADFVSFEGELDAEQLPAMVRWLIE